MALYNIYFSPTGNVRKITKTVAAAICEKLVKNGQLHNEEVFDLNITSLNSRKPYSFKKDDIVIVGFPVYAGRLPNKLIYYFQHLRGNGCKAIGVVSYGCRSYGDSLMEMDLKLRESGFDVCCLMAVPSSHSFAKIGIGRPSGSEMRSISKASSILAEKHFPSLEFGRAPGSNPPGPYYRPLEENGSFADFLKAKPVTDELLCDDCRMCAKICPMGAIDCLDVASVPGICIKCQGCVNVCHRNAKSFIDRSFLSHKAMLENNYIKNEVSLLIICSGEIIFDRP